MEQQDARGLGFCGPHIEPMIQMMEATMNGYLTRQAVGNVGRCESAKQEASWHRGCDTALTIGDGIIEIVFVAIRTKPIM